MQTNLANTVDNLQDVTIFAPSNAAFQAIGSAVGSLSTAQLANILEYHVINGTVGYSTLLTNESIPTVAGKNVTITIEDGSVFVNSAKVIVPNVLVANGVVHVIDKYVLPLSLIPLIFLYPFVSYHLTRFSPPSSFLLPLHCEAQTNTLPHTAS
jgi:uncharacterized surface protein with fasciclin (FAS1) repeats